MWKGAKAGDGGRLVGIDEVWADFKGGVAPPRMGGRSAVMVQVAT